MAHESVLVVGGRIDENSSQEKLSKFLYDGLVAAFGGNLDSLDPLFLECLTKPVKPTDTKEYGLTVEYALSENILLRVLFNPTSEQLRFGLQEALTHALGNSDGVVEYPVTPSTLGKASIVYTGQLLGFTGEWLLQDASFGGNNLVSWLDGEAAMSWWPHLKKFSNFGDQIKVNIFTPIAGTGTCWPVDKSGRPQTLLTQINARMAKLEINIEAVWRLNGKQLNMQGNLSGFQGLRSFVDDIIIHRHPISKILTDTDIPSVGTALDATRPVIYVFPGYGVTSQSCALFTVQGFTALLSGSYTTQTLPNWWPMVKHLPKLDAALIPDWSASNILTYRFIEEALKSGQNGNQIFGEILMPPSVNSSTDSLSDISSGLILSPPTSLSGAHHGTWASSASMSGDSIPPSLVLYSKLGWGELKLQPLSLRCGLLLMWESSVHGIPSQHPLCIAIPSVQPANSNPVQCLTRLMKALCQVPQLSGPPSSSNRTVSGKSIVKSTVKQQAATRTSLIRSTKPPTLNTTSTVKETIASKTTNNNNNNNNVNGRPAATRNITSSPLHQKPATTTTSAKPPLTAPTSKKPIHDKTTSDTKHVNNSHHGVSVDAHQKRPTSSSSSASASLLEAKKTKPFTTSTKQPPVSELSKPSSRPSTAAKSTTMAKSKPAPTTTTAERLAAHSNLVNNHNNNNNAAKLHTRRSEPTTHSASSNKLQTKKSTITGAKTNHHVSPKPISEEAEPIPAGTAESKDEKNVISAPVAVGIASAAAAGAAAVGVTAAAAIAATTLPHATQNDTPQSPLNDSLELASVDPLLSGWKGSTEGDNQEKDDVQDDHQNLPVIDDKEVLTPEENRLITDEQIKIRDPEQQPQQQPQPEEDIQQESMVPTTSPMTTVGGEEEEYKVHKVIQENMMLAEESDEQLNHEYESENEAKQPPSQHVEHELEVEGEQHEGEFKQSYNDSLVDENEDLNGNAVVEAEEEEEAEGGATEGDFLHLQEQHLQHQQHQQPSPQEQGSLYVGGHDDMTEETTVPYEKDDHISPEIEYNRVEMMQQYKTPFDDADPREEQNHQSIIYVAEDVGSKPIEVNNNFVEEENQIIIEAEHDNGRHDDHHLHEDDDEDEVIIHTSEDPVQQVGKQEVPVTLEEQQDEEQLAAEDFNVNDEHGGIQGYTTMPTSLPVCMIENNNNNVEPQQSIIDYNTTENVISREEIDVNDNAGGGGGGLDESSFNDSHYGCHNSYFMHTPCGDTVIYLGDEKDASREEEEGEVLKETVDDDDVEEATSYLNETCIHKVEEAEVEEQTHPDVAINSSIPQDNNNDESHLLVTEQMMKPADTDIDFVSSDVPSHMMTMAMPTKEEEEPIAAEEAVRADNPPEPEESVVPHPEEEECPFDANEQEKLHHQVEVQPQQKRQECEEDFDNEAGQSDIDEMETEFVIKYQKHQQQQEEIPTSMEEVYPVNQYTNHFEHYSSQPVDYEYAGNVMSSAQTMNTYSVDSSTDNDQRLRSDFPSPLCEEKKATDDEQQQQQHTDMLVMMAADESVQKVDSTTHDDSSLLINDQVRKFDENQIDDTYQVEDNATAATTTTTGLHIDTAETVTEYQPMCSPDSEVSDDSIIRRPDHHQQQQQLEEQHYNKEEEGEVEHEECDTDYLHDDEQVQQTSVVNSLMSTPNRCISPNQNIVSSTHPNDDDDDGYDGNDQYDVTLVGKQFNEGEEGQQHAEQLLDYSSLAQQQAYSSSISLNNNNTNVSMMPTTTTMTTDDDADGDADGDGDVNTTVINCMPSEGDFNGIATTAFESQLHTDLSTASTSTPLHHHPLHQEQHSDDVDEVKELNYSMNITSTTAINNNNNYPYTNGFNLNGGGNANGYSNFEQISTNNNNNSQGLDENHHYNYLYNNNNSSMNQSEQPNQLLETTIDDHDDDHITTSELLKSAHLSSHSPYTSRQMLNNCDDNDFSGNNNPMTATPKTPPPSATLSASSLKEFDNLNNTPNSNNNNKDYHGDIIDHMMQDPHYANTATPTTTPTADESIFDPIKQWGQPLGLPAPVPPSTTTNHHMKVSHAPNVSAKRIRSADTGGKTTSATGDSNELTLPPGPPVYLDVIWVPNYLIRVPQSMIVDFFTRVRSKMYILSGEALHPNIAEALITAKAKWNPDDVAYLCRCDANSSDAVITILPTYEPKEWIRWLETPCGRLDEQKGSDRLAANHFRLLPAVNLCSTQFNAGDMIFECEGLRVEF